MSVQEIRDEIATALSETGWNGYSTTPGSAELPATVVGMPTLIDPTHTVGYWRIEIPVYLVLPNSVPSTSEPKLLGRLPELVTTLKAMSAAGRAVRVVEIDSFFDVTVGNKSAISAAVNLEIFLPNPT